jgi:hypothetical protein
MNYLQRFSIALARSRPTRSDAASSRPGPGGSGFRADWLSEVKSLAQTLPPVRKSPDNSGK